MTNNYTENLKRIALKEQELNTKIADAEEDANRKLAELHSYIEQLYILKKAEKAVLLDVNEFIETVKDKVFKIDVEGLGHKQNEVLQALETALWGINKALDLYKDIEYTIKRGSAD